MNNALVTRIFFCFFNFILRKAVKIFGDDTEIQCLILNKKKNNHIAEKYGYVINERVSLT